MSTGRRKREFGTGTVEVVVATHSSVMEQFFGVVGRCVALLGAVVVGSGRYSGGELILWG